MLGHAYVVVIKENGAKVFINQMDNKGLLDEFKYGKIIFYRNFINARIERETKFYEVLYEANALEAAGLEITEEEKQEFSEACDDEDEIAKKAAEARVEKAREENNKKNIQVIDDILVLAKEKDHIRKRYLSKSCIYLKDIKNYVNSHARDEKNKGKDEKETIESLKEELDRINAELVEVQDDNVFLQEQKIQIEEDLRREKEEKDNLDRDLEKAKIALGDKKREHEDLKEEKCDLESRCTALTQTVNGFEMSMKKEYKPLLNFPPFGLSEKDKIIAWIEQYYSDTLIVHDNAKRSFKNDNKNLEWKKFCLMIHYLAGYTKVLNEGQAPETENLIRYDVEDNGFVCQRSSTGKGGALDIYRDRYIIDISRYDSDEQDVTMDMHITRGRGRDADMIRIYFYYDANIKKSIIGYMPDHLPTRKDGH